MKVNERIKFKKSDGTEVEEVFWILACDKEDCPVLQEQWKPGGKKGVYHPASIQDKTAYVFLPSTSKLDGCFKKSIDDITGFMVYHRFNGLSYQKIADLARDTYGITLSWQAVQGRVNRHINTLLNP